MKNKLFFIIIVALGLASCNNNQNHDDDDHNHNNHIDQHDDHDDHQHDNHGHNNHESHDSHDNHNHGDHSNNNHEEVKIQLTAYSNDFELFAEADNFVVGETSNILSHFSKLPSFKALESGKMTIRLIVNGNETVQTLENPTRKGIYSFDIKPKTAGKGKILFNIKSKKGNYNLTVPEITVYSSHHHDTHDEPHISKTNTTIFTKEQSWKVDFATEYPLKEPFGQVIKTTAIVQSAQGDEIIVTAKTNGIIKITKNSIIEGKKIFKNQSLFSILNSEMVDNNLSVRFEVIKSNFNKAKLDFERAKGLAKDQIISEKELLEVKSKYEIAKVKYNNLNKNFNSKGQKVLSPMNGFITQLFIKNGSYVIAGQQVATISQNKTLILSIEVQQKYASVLASINSANIRTFHDNKIYTLKQLSGHVLSFGRSINNGSHLIPLKIQIDNKGSFIPGGIVEVYLKTIINSEAITVPNSALMEEQGFYFVFVQVTPELFEKREVKISVSDGLKTEITQGITLNDRIVTKGAILVKLAQATGGLDAHSAHVH